MTRLLSGQAEPDMAEPDMDVSMRGVDPTCSFVRLRFSRSIFCTFVSSTTDHNKLIITIMSFSGYLYLFTEVGENKDV